MEKWQKKWQLVRRAPRRYETEMDIYERYAMRKKRVWNQKLQIGSWFLKSAGRRKDFMQNLYAGLLHFTHRSRYTSPMAKQYKKSIFLFRRDLRLVDNTGLNAALAASDTVLPIFIFDPAQTDPTVNPYFSAPAFAFLHNSLTELQNALQKNHSSLLTFHDDPANILEKIIVSENIDAVFVNKDYTPFARRRDATLAAVCEQHAIPFSTHDDYTLSPIETIATNQATPYTVFTPFLKNAMRHLVAKPYTHAKPQFYTSTIPIKTSTITPPSLPPHAIVSGGRTEGLRLLRSFAHFKDYKLTRDTPALAGTSLLSAHHKFGTISIRETYHTALQHAGTANQFVTELYWRDFYMYIAYHFPTVFKQSFLPWAHHIVWRNNIKEFTAWCEGNTGIPIIDAAMRELHMTGWMHNRTRMIVASFLTKNLLIDWRWGERFFAQKLIDYDPSQNNGGWQWSASVGADPRPLRIFNPYTQTKQHDPHATYIKQWVPELRQVASQLLTDGTARDFSTLAAHYPPPIVDQKESYHRARTAYKEAHRQHDLTQV